MTIERDELKHDGGGDGEAVEHRATELAEAAAVEVIEDADRLCTFVFDCQPDMWDEVSWLMRCISAPKQDALQERLICDSVLRLRILLLGACVTASMDDFREKAARELAEARDLAKARIGHRHCEEE